MGKQKPYNLYKRKKKLKNGKVSTTYYYCINPSSGVPPSICRKEQRETTGCTTKSAGITFILSRIENLKKTRAHTESKQTLREYSEPFWIWETCPHVDRFRSEGKSITRNHVEIQRLVMQKHLFPDPIVETPLSEISRDTILQFRFRLIQKHGHGRTVQKMMSLLKTILKEAYFRKHIDRDPTVGIGKVKYEQTEVGTFTESELSQLFAEAPGIGKDKMDYTVFLIAATTGIRRGEILALRWQDIDFEQAFIKVEQALKERTEIGLPKWNKKRIVPIPHSTIEALWRLHEESIRTAPDDLILCYDDGTRLGGTWWKKRFTPAREKAGIDYQGRNLSPHSFRHTLNTLLRNQGVSDINLRAVFGWTSEKIQDGRHQRYPNCHRLRMFVVWHTVPDLSSYWERWNRMAAWVRYRLRNLQRYSDWFGQCLVLYSLAL
jgi:integrase